MSELTDPGGTPISSVLLERQQLGQTAPVRRWELFLSGNDVYARLDTTGHPPVEQVVGRVHELGARAYHLAPGDTIYLVTERLVWPSTRKSTLSFTLNVTTWQDLQSTSLASRVRRVSRPAPRRGWLRSFGQLRTRLSTLWSSRI